MGCLKVPLLLLLAGGMAFFIAMVYEVNHGYARSWKTQKETVILTIIFICIIIGLAYVTGVVALS